MARKRQTGGGGGDSWLNTYADMVTLLLTFFAVLLSMSKTDEEKFNAFIRSFSNLPQSVIEEIIGTSDEPSEDGELTTVNDTEMDELFKMLAEYVAEHNQQDAVDISKVDDVICIRFSSALFFEPDRYELLRDSVPTLSFVGDGLKKYETKIRMVNILGHTASTTGVSEVDEWLLSGERAAVVARYLEGDKQFDPRKLLIMGYGKQYPIADNDTEEGRRLNRRVELVIVGTESGDDFNINNALEQLYGGKAEEGSAGDVLFPQLGTNSAPSASEPETPTAAGDSGDVAVGVSPYED